MLENINFTDPQGLVHTGAVFKLRRADEQCNTSSYKHLSTADFTTYDEGGHTPAPFINYQVYYWASAAAKANGNAPYILVNIGTPEASMDFNFSATAEYDGLSLEAKVDKHLTDVVLPSMLNV